MEAYLFLEKDFGSIPSARLIDQEVFGPFRGRFDIVPAALGEEVVVHGALALRATPSRTEDLIPLT